MSSRVIYVSTDVEADGPVPGIFSMLSIGSAAYTPSGNLLSTFADNLCVLPEASEDPETMKFWGKNPKAWKAATKKPREPKEVMIEYLYWVKNLPGKPVFCAWPLGFDWSFVYYYLIRFCGESPFGFSGLDIKSLACGVLGKDYTKISKNQVSKYVGKNIHHTHVAIEDAMEQGELLIGLIKELSKR